MRGILIDACGGWSDSHLEAPTDSQSPLGAPLAWGCAKPLSGSFGERFSDG